MRRAHIEWTGNWTLESEPLRKFCGFDFKSANLGQKTAEAGSDSNSFCFLEFF